MPASLLHPLLLATSRPPLATPLAISVEETCYIRPVIPFEPHPRLLNPNWMTLAGRFWPRSLERLPPPVERYFEVEPGIRLLAHCHWQAGTERRSRLRQ